MEPIRIKIKTLTPIWTGGVDRGCVRVHETGILGSLRWWYEAIVRGLGGYACDPTDESAKCKEYDFKRGPKSVCAACYLFGCMGWARKFRFEIRGDNSNKLGALVQQRIRANQTLWLVFRPIRPVNLVEITLFWRTVQLISKYGAISARTVFKPSEVTDNNRKTHHQDFGLIKLISSVPTNLSTKSRVEQYARGFRPRGSGNSEWPNLKNFWFINKTLDRKSHNEIVNRPTTHTIPNDYLTGTTPLQKWLGGSQGVSKKIFSFHTNGAQRTFGYSKEGELEDVIPLVSKKTNWEVSALKRGTEVIDELFK